ncbi:hypothetical protein FIBSPDRAFT_856817, partial [Athelia psychrophila]
IGKVDGMVMGGIERSQNFAKSLRVKLVGGQRKISRCHCTPPTQRHGTVSS